MLEKEHPIKHGVKVFGASAVNSWFIPVSKRDPDWNLALSTTWQVRRSDFDAMLLKEAEARGATVMQGTATKALLTDDGAVRTMAHALPMAGVTSAFENPHFSTALGLVKYAHLVQMDRPSSSGLIQNAVIVSFQFDADLFV